jgi:hypothetical protein
MIVPRAGAGTTGIPQPLPAERARTVAARASAALHAVGVGAVEFTVAGTTAAGQVLVVVPSDGGWPRRWRPRRSATCRPG